MSDQKVRLSKLMSEKGLCSRREADRYISEGLVFVNGVRISELGTKVDPSDQIELAKKAQNQQDQLVSILLNKPIGYVSNLPEHGYHPAIEIITSDSQWQDSPTFRSFTFSMLKNIAVAGRLDIDSQGLLLFTQDGRIAKTIIGENSEIEKEYLVRFKGPITQDSIKKLRFGLSLDGKALKPAKVEQINPDQLKVILREGKKRQIRRMLELVDLSVTGLKRVRIGKLMLGHLPEGQWRFLGSHEVI